MATLTKTPDIHTIRRSTQYSAPTTVRLSDSLLLSDLLSCHSIYEHGCSNSVREGDWSMMLREASHLAELLESLQAEHGTFSVTYARISPSLSEKIVSWGDPSAPSLHRYDAGAAADVIFHDHVQKRGNLGAPILLANAIDENYDYSRMITYSESQGICLATKVDESGPNGRPRRAMMENRYCGFRKPEHIKWGRAHRAQTPQQVLDSLNSIDYRGQGRPSYHLKGAYQLQHRRTSACTTALDFMYHERNVEYGAINRLPVTSREGRHVWKRFEQAGRMIDAVVTEIGRRVSIIEGYRMNATRSDHNWQKEWSAVLVPPQSVPASMVTDLLDEKRQELGITAIGTRGRKIRVKGR